ncbi:MAG: RNA 3'-terminal phosphate cyclase [archaeon]|jgi:RNA 3'-phosphate cyclase|nr:RNA 3'-terminal phosphate cyclase [archaeon]
MMESIEIDGSQGEGGGQILRTSFALAALKGQSIKITKIRAGRERPGLKPQHVAALQVLSSICTAEIKGADRGSEEVEFSPKEINSTALNVNIGTAGSISLLLQQLLPVALKANLKIRIFGGTNVDWSPPMEFYQELFFPLLKKMGARFEAKVSKRGYFPKGKGSVNFSSGKVKLPLKPINLGNFLGVEEVAMFSHSSNLPKDVSLIQASSAKKLILEKFPGTVFFKTIEFKEKSNTIGSGITLIASDSKGNKLCASSSGRRGKQAAVVGKEAAEKLISEISAGKAVDSHTADQLIPFMALANGKSTIHCGKLTKHCLTNIAICEKLLGVKFEVKGIAEKPAKISVEGIGFT